MSDDTGHRPPGCVMKFMLNKWAIIMYFSKVLIILWEYFAGLVNAALHKWRGRSNNHVTREKR